MGITTLALDVHVGGPDSTSQCRQLGSGPEVSETLIVARRRGILGQLVLLSRMQSHISTEGLNSASEEFINTMCCLNVCFVCVNNAASGDGNCQVALSRIR
jgi:hypothetical protein